MKHPYSTDLFPMSAAVEPAALGTVLGDAFRDVVEGIDSMFRNAFDSNANTFVSHLGLPSDAASYWDLFRRSDWALIARPDVIVDESGTARVVELNAASSAVLQTVHDDIARRQISLRSDGAVDLPSGARIYSCTAPIARHMDPSSDGFTFFGLWDIDIPPDRTVPHWSISAYVDEFRELGYRADWGAIEELDGLSGSLTYGSSAVTGVFRFFDYAAHIGSLELELLDQLDHRYEAGLHVASSFVGELIHKSAMGLISDERLADRWPAHDRKRACRAMPWTRLMADSTAVFSGDEAPLAEIAHRHQQAMVLKPVDGGRGRGVLIGAEQTEEAWRTGVVQAMQSPNRFLLQEKVVGVNANVKWKGSEEAARAGCTVYSPFFLERRLTGVVRRTNTRPGLIVSATNGAIPSPVFWVGPRQPWEARLSGLDTQVNVSDQKGGTHYDNEDP